MRLQYAAQPRPTSSQPTQRLLMQWCVSLFLCGLLLLAPDTVAAASVYPSVAICNLNTQVYVRDAPVGHVVTFWFNATDCSDVSNAVVSGSLFVTPPTNNATATTNNVTLQFPSWAVNWPYDHLVVCARDAVNRELPVAPPRAGSSSPTSEKSLEAVAEPIPSDDRPLEVTFIWPPVPLRTLLNSSTGHVRDSSRSRLAATIAATVEMTFEFLGETRFYDLYHAPTLHWLSHASSPPSSDPVANATFYVGLRQRVTTPSSPSEYTIIMMPSFCANAACEESAESVTYGRALTAAESEYVLAVLASSVLYVDTRLVSEAATPDSRRDTCTALKRVQSPDASAPIQFRINDQLVPTANLSVDVVSSGSPSSTPPRWLIVGTFTNLTSDQYAEGRYPLCLAPAFIYLGEPTTTLPVPSWTSAQGQGMAGLTTLTPDVFTVRAHSALLSEETVLWDISTVFIIEAASSATWPTPPGTNSSQLRYTIVAGEAGAASCRTGTVLFAGALLPVTGQEALQRRTPRLRLGPASLNTTVESSDVVATAEVWASLFPNSTQAATDPAVAVSVCVDLNNPDEEGGTDTATTWAGTVTLHQLHAYSTAVLLATENSTTARAMSPLDAKDALKHAQHTQGQPPRAATATTVEQRASSDDAAFSLCAVPSSDAFASTAATSLFLSTSSDCRGQRYSLPTVAPDDGHGDASYLPPQTGVAYVLCLSVNTTDPTISGPAAEEITAAPAQRPIRFVAAPNITAQPAEVYFDTPFTLSVALDPTTAAAAVFAIPSTESCESLQCPPDANYAPTMLSAMFSVSNGNVTVEVPMSASGAIDGVTDAIRLCLAILTEGTPGSERNVSLTTLPILSPDPTTTVPPVPIVGVYPTTIVKGQLSVLRSTNLQSGNANLAYDAACNQFLFSPSVSIQAGRVTLTVPRCATVDEAYYCERPGPSFPYVSTAKLSLVSLFNCTSNEPINLLPVTVPPATPVTAFGVVLNGNLTNSTPFLSEGSNCAVPPSALARAVQRHGYMTALSEIVQFFVCVTSRDGTLNFTNVEYGPTLTIAPFALSPQFSALGVAVASTALSPAVPIPDSTFIIRGIRASGWNGTLVSNTVSLTPDPDATNWTSALCNITAPDENGAERAWWNASALGRGEDQWWLAEWGPSEADTVAYYANMGPYFVCSSRADVVADASRAADDAGRRHSSAHARGGGTNASLVPISAFLSLAPPLVEWLTPTTMDSYVCARMLVPGGLYSLLPDENSTATSPSWSRGVYLMPTTASEYAAAVAANENLCAEGPYRTPSAAASTALFVAVDDVAPVREGYSGVGLMSSDLVDVVCMPTFNLTGFEEALFLACSGTPAGFQQTNQTTTLTARHVTPVDLTGGATVTMSLPDWPSKTIIFTPAAAGCAAIPDGMPSFTTNATGTGTVTLVVISSSLGVPLRPLDAGTYVVCHRLSWRSPADPPSSPKVASSMDSASRSGASSHPSQDKRVAQSWVTNTAWAPLTTLQVYDAIFYDISSDMIAVNVTSSLFLLESLTAGVLKPGFYTSFDCRDESAVDMSVMNWSLVEPEGPSASGPQQLEVIAHHVPTLRNGTAANVYLCAFTPLNATYQPVPNNKDGISVIVDPLFFRKSVHRCEQLDVFFSAPQLTGSSSTTVSVQMVNGPCCNPDGAALLAATVQVGTALARFYRSFLLNDTTMSALSPTTQLNVCASYRAALSSGVLEPKLSCTTAGVVTVLPEDSYCDVNPGVLPYLVLPPRADVYRSGVAPSFLTLAWAALIAIAVVAGVVLLFIVIIMIVGCATKRPPRRLKDEAGWAETLTQTPPMWQYRPAARTVAEAEAVAARKRAQPAREAAREKQVLDCLQSQLLPAMPLKEVAERVPLSLRGTPQALHAKKAPSAARDAFYDPVALYLDKKPTPASHSIAIDAPATATGAEPASTSVTPAEDGKVAAATQAAPLPSPVADAELPAAAAPRRLVSAPSPSLSPSASPSARSPPAPLMQGADSGPLCELEAEETAARAQLAEDEDNALYHVLQAERCRWRDLMAGEGVRLKTLLEQDPFWSSRLAMLESLNARALERAAERSLVRECSESATAGRRHDANNGADPNNAADNGRPSYSGADQEGVWGAGRTVPPPPPSDDDNAFSTPSGVMTPLSETVLVFPAATPGTERAAVPPAHLGQEVEDVDVPHDDPAALDAEGLATMHSHISDPDEDDGALDLDERLFSPASGGGDSIHGDRRPRRVNLLQTPATSAARGGPPATMTAAVSKPRPNPPLHRDPQSYLPPPPTNDDDDEHGGLYSDLSGGGESASHPPRWTPPPPPPLQQGVTRGTPGAYLGRGAVDDNSHSDSAFSEASAHKSSHEAAKRRHERPAARNPTRGHYNAAHDVDAVRDRQLSDTTDVANPLPIPAQHLWAKGEGVAPADAANGGDVEEGSNTGTSGTGLLYSPTSADRRLTVPRAAVSPSAHSQAARELSWSPPSAMASTPREGKARTAPPPSAPQETADANTRGRKKDSHCEDLDLDEL